MIPVWAVSALGWLKKVPAGVWIGIAVVSVGGYGLHRFGSARYDAGAASVQSRWDKAVAKANAATVERQTERAEVTTKVETVYVDRVETIRGATIEKIIKVPIYVQADSCSLSGGFRLFHDWASLPTGPIPDPAAVTDAAPVDAQTIAGTVAGNYGTCHENAARLTALQDWVTKQAGVR
jgi:hypothetical protein